MSPTLTPTRHRTVRRVEPVQSPPASRVATPRWRDGRLVLGVVLVLVAVLAGARVLGGEQRTTTVLVAARSLAAGHPLESGDLQVRRLRLSGVTDRYWPSADLTGLTGHRLETAVAAGDLLARSAVAPTADPRPTRLVAVPVDPARMAAVAAGDRVDVFATYQATAQSPARTQVVIRGAEYVGGGDTGTETTLAIRLRVETDKAGALVRASQLAKLDIVLQEPAGDDAGDVGDQVVPDPAPSVDGASSSSTGSGSATSTARGVAGATGAGAAGTTVGGAGTGTSAAP